MKSSAPLPSVQYPHTHMNRPHAEEQATVTCTPRTDVQAPTSRLSFKNGNTLTVPYNHISVYQLTSDAPLMVDEARRLPSWKYLIQESRYLRRQTEIDSPPTSKRSSYPPHATTHPFTTTSPDQRQEDLIHDHQ